MYVIANGYPDLQSTRILYKICIKDAKDLACDRFAMIIYFITFQTAS